MRTVRVPTVIYTHHDGREEPFYYNFEWRARNAAVMIRHARFEWTVREIPSIIDRIRGRKPRPDQMVRA